MLFAKSVEVDFPGASLEERLQRAKGYPYTRPDSSFIFAGGSAHLLGNYLWKGPLNLKEMLSTAAPDSTFELLEYEGVEWHPVLAIGSNASPEQLARKYNAQKGVIIPVVQCVLRDFDVVYAPLVSSYGSCTATLEYSPGTLVEVFVTYLTSPLMERMIETEGAYDLIRMKNIDLKLGISLKQLQGGEEGVEHLDSILQFNHQHGCLRLPLEHHSNGNRHKRNLEEKGWGLSVGETSCVSLAEILAQNRQFPAFEQVEMLQRIMEICHGSNGVDLDSWILTNLDEEDARLSTVEVLASMRHPFSYKDTDVIARIGNIHSKNVK